MQLAATFSRSFVEAGVAAAREQAFFEERADRVVSDNVQFLDTWSIGSRCSDQHVAIAAYFPSFLTS